MNLQEITNTLRTTRRTKGLTIEQLGTLAGKKKQYINLVENGSNVSVKNLVTICDALGLTITIQ